MTVAEKQVPRETDNYRGGSAFKSSGSRQRISGSHMTVETPDTQRNGEDGSPKAVSRRRHIYRREPVRKRKGLRFAGRLMFDDGIRHGVDALKNLARGLGIGNLESIRLVEGHDQLQGVH